MIGWRVGVAVVALMVVEGMRNDIAGGDREIEGGEVLKKKRRCHRLVD